MIDHYDWPGGREAMLRFGPATGPVVIAAMPLFEEANRTRAFMVSILRGLAERGIGGMLPDLPGAGESLVPTECTTLMQMREAFESAAELLDGEGRVIYSVAIRSGALLDTFALAFGRWQLAPMNGESLLHDLHRIRQASSDVERRKFDPLGFLGGDSGPPMEIAGNLVSHHLLGELHGSMPFSTQEGVALRIVRLESDPGPADRKVAGSPLWRRNEPDNDPALAQLLAEDIAAWIATCAA